MDLSQFKIRSFIIGIIALGLVIILISFGINQIYKTFVRPSNEKAVVIPSSTPNPSASTNPRATTTPTPGTTPRPNQSPAASPAASNQPNPTNKGGIAMNPTTGPDDIEIKNPGITIDNVKSGDSISSAQSINGRANVTNTKVVIQILNLSGNVLGETNTNGCIGYDACPFSTTISYQTGSRSGWLYAYNPSDDGKRYYEVKIPVNLN